MIESITLKDIATFIDEVQVSNLKKVNFIYGSNGSGKTTISNYIHDSSSEKFNSCSLKWLNDQPLAPLVYNKNFRERNFSSDSINGVFTLGEATKEQLEKIEELEAELDRLKKEVQGKLNLIDSLDRLLTEELDRFKESAWTLYYKKHEADFKDAFRGFLTKQGFYDKLLLEHKKNTSELRPIEYLKAKSKTIFGAQPTELPMLQVIQFANLLEIESDGIWSKKIIGKSDVDISKLILKLNMNDWVSTGREFLQEDKTCPFCQQDTITVGFRKQLEDYFDEEYLTALASVKKLQESYSSWSSNIIELLNGIEIKEKENQNSKLDIDSFSAQLKTLISQLTTNKERIETKRKEPSRELELISNDAQLNSILELLISANDVIKAHNLIVSNFNAEKLVLTNQVWRYIVEQAKTEIEPHVKKVAGLKGGIAKAQEDFKDIKTKYNSSKAELIELTKNVTSVQPAVNEINRILNAYGFTNFLIVPSEEHSNKYQILRENGELAQTTLSEGEITFITFLYFLQMCKGGLTEATVNDERILVIDDPISSLDSTILFVISSLIKEIIKNIREDRGNIKQLILLTHNVYFHKEVSFIDGRTKKKSDTFYWIIRKRDKKSSIQSYEMGNPISTSYELLWQELIEREKNSGIAIQNVMRRIIENYFKILGRYGDDQLILKFDNRENQEICRSLISWINDGSHGVAEDLFIEAADDAIERYFEVFKQIFIKTDHLGHYNMMMRIEDELEEVIETVK